MSFLKVNWFDAISTAQVTDAEEVTGLLSFALQLYGTGQLAANSTVNLETSVDGINYNLINSQNAPSNGRSVISFTNAVPVRFVRLNLTSSLQPAAGTSPTLSVSVLGV